MQGLLSDGSSHAASCEMLTVGEGENRQAIYQLSLVGSWGIYVVHDVVHTTSYHICDEAEEGEELGSHFILHTYVAVVRGVDRNQASSVDVRQETGRRRINVSPDSNLSPAKCFGSITRPQFSKSPVMEAAGFERRTIVRPNNRHTCPAP
jgi:hypothetical protein